MALFKLAKALFMPSSAVRYVPYLLIIPIIVFQTLSLTGCVSTSPAIPSIYIVSLRPNTNTTENQVQVRIGYFGICGIDDDGTRCVSASGRSVETLTANLFPDLLSNNRSSSSSSSSAAAATAPADITDLVTTAIDLQSRAFPSILAAAAVLFVLGVAVLFLFKRDVRGSSSLDHPRRSGIVRRATYGLLFLSTGLVFAASLATSQAAGALEFASVAMRDASVLIKAGTTIQVLQWTTFGFSLLFSLAVPFLVRPRSEPAFKGEV
ncbi:hypothetical protein VTK56DRAFT_2683 [Thermocarpiscus australiensis]